MLKVVGGLIIAAASVLIGIAGAAESREKERFLAEMAAFAGMCRERIRYTSAERAELIGEGIKRYKRLSWLTGDNKVNKGDCYGYGDRVSLFSDMLGRSDREGQIRLCEQTEEFFKNECETQRKKCDSDCRVKITLGIFFAAAVIIMII